MIRVLSWAAGLTATLLTLTSSCYGSPQHGGQRRILALFDSRFEKIPADTLTHRLIEAPLNTMGLTVAYHDWSRGAPLNDLKSSDLLGLLSFFPPGARVQRPREYVRFLLDALDAQKRVVVFGDLGFWSGSDHNSLSLPELNQFLGRFGLATHGSQLVRTPDISAIEFDPSFVAPGTNFEPSLDALPIVEVTDQRTRVIVEGRRRGLETDSPIPLTVIAQQAGALAFPGSALYFAPGTGRGDEIRRWLVDPFLFLHEAFRMAPGPIPDVTTYFGRRGLMVLIDGPGWSSLSRIERYLRQRAPAATVLATELFENYPEVHFTVAPVTGELDAAWGAPDNSEQVARSLASYRNVAFSSSGYSDIWDWNYFQSEKSSRDERSLLGDYPPPVWSTVSTSANVSTGPKRTFGGWPRPRRLAAREFELRSEIVGSLDYLRNITGTARPPACLIWSGSRRPFRSALTLATREIGCTIGEGRSRVDPRFPSIAWLEPLSRPASEVDGDITLTSQSARLGTVLFPLAGELEYLDAAPNQEFAYRYAAQSLSNTENVRRLRPIALRFGFEAGVSPARLDAVRSLLSYSTDAQTHSLSVASYHAAVKGLEELQITRCGGDCWEIDKRGGLSTVRFDQMNDPKIDWRLSRGVLGWRQVGQSVYVALDEHEGRATLALCRKKTCIDRASLIESSWRVRKLLRSRKGISFETEGLTSGSMTWRVPWRSAVAITVEKGGDNSTRVVPVLSSGIVALELPPSETPITVLIEEVNET